MYSDEKNLVKAWLKEFGLPEFKLTARTVGNPFGGADKVFVTIKDWVPHLRAADLEVRASVHSFAVRFDGPSSGVYCSEDQPDTAARKKEIRREYMTRLAAETAQ